MQYSYSQQLQKRPPKDWNGSVLPVIVKRWKASEGKAIAHKIDGEFVVRTVLELLLPKNKGNEFVSYAFHTYAIESYSDLPRLCSLYRKEYQRALDTKHGARYIKRLAAKVGDFAEVLKAYDSWLDNV
jgi:hypothetical protein